MLLIFIYLFIFLFIYLFIIFYSRVYLEEKLAKVKEEEHYQILEHEIATEGAERHQKQNVQDSRFRTELGKEENNNVKVDMRQQGSSTRNGSVSPDIKQERYSPVQHGEVSTF